MKKYEKYKVSNTELVKEIPELWISSKLKYVLKTMKSGGTPDSNNSDYYSSDGIPWVSIGDMSNVDFVFDTAKHLSKDGVSSKNLTIYPQGTILYSIYATLGKVSELVSSACINQAILALCPNDRIEKQFLKYSLKSQEDFVRSISSSNTQSNLNADKVSNMPVFLPPIGDQKKISSFLDYKTGKIDSLVTLLTNRIEDLKKYRQAIISETVTHGLDKSAKMKDSGVEWIGEIPESWSIIRLRFLGASQNGISKSKEFFGQGYPFVSYSDVYKNESLPQNPSGLVLSTEEERKNFSVKEGDVFFTRTSETAEEIGFSSVCEKTIENATFAGFLIRFRPNPGVLNKGFSKYFFRSDIHRWYFVNKMNIVTRASLSQDILMSMPVVLPPLSDQQAIADYLDRKTKQIDDCIAATEQRIDDLQKYRTSLIYEAVTGQIDVRDWSSNTK